MPNNTPDNDTAPQPSKPKLCVDNFENLTLEEQLELIDIIFERRRKKINELINKAIGIK